MWNEITIITCLMVTGQICKAWFLGKGKWTFVYYLTLFGGTLGVMLNTLIATRDPELVSLWLFSLLCAWQAVMSVVGLIRTRKWRW
jgi:hypothetical protein